MYAQKLCSSKEVELKCLTQNREVLTFYCGIFFLVLLV